MRNIRIVEGENSAIAFLSDETYVTNIPEVSTIVVWRGDIEIEKSDGSRAELWHWNIVTISPIGVPIRIGTSLDQKNSPLYRGMFPAKPLEALDDILAFLCNTVDQPENSDTFSRQVVEWAQRWGDMLDEASQNVLD